MKFINDENAPSLKLKNATLEFKNISFTYPDGTHALKNLICKNRRWNKSWSSR